VAQARKTTPARIIELNAIAPGEVVRGGTVLLVPHGSPPTVGAPDPAKPVVVVPQDLFVYPGRTRVFYRVLTGDTLPDIAKHLHVDVDDVRRWNDLDPAARLQDGMTLQAFVPEGADLSHVVTLRERDARVLVAGTDDFFTYWEGTKGKRRVVVSAKAGETLEAIGKRYGVNLASLERINGRPRRDVLKEGDTVVVYLPAPGASPKEPPALGPSGPSTPNELLLTLPAPTPNGPLPPAPEASLLPPLP
jgi:membrane-bound lytic murein transglycosylase D